MINYGKRFEEDFKNSIPDYCLVHRLRDSAQSYNNSENTKFSWDNECDFFLFDEESRTLFCIELKSTKYKTMNWQIDKKDKSSKMIKYHQIESLELFSKYKNVIPCLVLNFRNDEDKTQRSYFIHINDFIKMTKSIDRKSFDEIHLIQNGAIKISGKRKRVRYEWDIDELINKLVNTTN